MQKMTITEALAEIKTISKRMDKKRQFVDKYLVRPEALRDPLEKEGGSEQVVAQEIQALEDLGKRWVAIRMAIQKANMETSLTLTSEKVSMSIAEWLVWRREVAGGEKSFWERLTRKVQDSQHFQFKDASGDVKNYNPVLSVSATSVTQSWEKIDNVLGQLDGQLSLRNATTFIELPD